MKWCQRTIAIMLSAIIIALTPSIIGRIPLPPKDLAAKAEFSWTGVLQIWLWETWQPGIGSLSPWLTRCAAKFEKRNPGVYVQIIKVDSRKQQQLLTASGILPDGLVFSSGTLNDHSMFVQVSGNTEIREELLQSAVVDDAVYALPIAMGGYGMGYNRGGLKQPPDDYGTLLAAQYKEATKRTHAKYGLGASSEDRWGIALMAIMGDNMRLDTKLLPPDFLACSYETAWSIFTKGDYICMPVTQRAVYRMSILQERGRGFALGIAPSSIAYTDQVAYYGVLNSKRKEADDVMQMSAKFMSTLVNAENQNALSIVGAFSVLPDIKLYPTNANMTTIESSLNGVISLPYAFNTTWQSGGNKSARDVLNGTNSLTNIWDSLDIFHVPLNDLELKDDSV